MKNEKLLLLEHVKRQKESGRIPLNWSREND